jgi:hypothetical protein
MDWYESILPAAVIRTGGRVDQVLIYRDIDKAIDHAPDVAGPWALMIQYLLAFDRHTAEEIWEEFTTRFLIESPEGAHARLTPGSETEDIRTTCLAVWLSREVGDERTFEQTLSWADTKYEPRFDHNTGEFAYWFNLDEPHPRGQWNNAIMNAFVAADSTWSSILQ